MVVVRSFRGHYSPEEHRGVEVPGIYWHFVDVMWVVVVLDGLRPLSVLNPLRSEEEAFRAVVCGGIVVWWGPCCSGGLIVRCVVARALRGRRAVSSSVPKAAASRRSGARARARGRTASSSTGSVLVDRPPRGPRRRASRQQQRPKVTTAPSTPAAISVVCAPMAPLTGPGEREGQRQQADRDQPVEARDAAEQRGGDVALLGGGPHDRAGRLQGVEGEAGEHELPHGGGQAVAGDGERGQRPRDVHEGDVAPRQAALAEHDGAADRADAAGGEDDARGRRRCRAGRS